MSDRVSKVVIRLSRMMLENLNGQKVIIANLLVRIFWVVKPDFSVNTDTVSTAPLWFMIL